jgi:hypothetical protein
MYNNFKKGNNSQLWSITSWTFQSSCRLPPTLARAFDVVWTLAAMPTTLEPHVDSKPHFWDIGFPCKLLPALWKPFGYRANFRPTFETFHSHNVIISWFGVSWLRKWFWKVWNLPILSLYMFKFLVFMRSLHINR